MENEDYELVLVMSEYKVATNEINNQIEKINSIVKAVDKDCMVIGEAPCTKDLIEITATDFAIVSAVSIGLVFVIIFVLFRSISLPVLLLSVIEFAIFVNMSFATYMNATIPFIASIVIGTIQLGATVDYAILMTTQYMRRRREGLGKLDAITGAHESSVSSIFVSALSFFAATFGVGIFSGIDMISSLCIMMARGALVSMFAVGFVLPSLLHIFDGVIMHTTMGTREIRNREHNVKTKMKEA